MATNKSRVPSKPKQPTQNTSAPAMTENNAEALATEAAKVASQVTTSETVSHSSENVAVPPRGKMANANPVVSALKIASKVEGFRRAGRPWSREQQTVSIDEFSQEQIEALLSEPMLEVVVVAE